METAVLAEDFMIVKKSTTRSGKVQHVSRANPEKRSDSPTPNSSNKHSDSPDSRTLAEVMGIDAESLRLKNQSKEKQEEEAKKNELRKKLWNYLGDGQNPEGRVERSDTLTEMTLPKLSFEAIMKEEQAKKPMPRRNTIDELKHGKDFKTKNAWGMKQEEGPVTDFAVLLD